MKKQESTTEEQRTFDRMMSKARQLARVPFEPVSMYMISAKWIDFRTFLLSDDGLDHMRSDKDFKWSIHLLNVIIESLIKLEYETDESVTEDTFCRLASQLTDDIALGDDSDYKAIQKLAETLTILESAKGRYSIAAPEDLFELHTDLETIIRSQQIAMKAAAYRIQHNLTF